MTPTPYPGARVVGLNLGVLNGFLPIKGTIFVDDLSSYTHGYIDKEISFILAHELAHLFNNHLIGTLFWYLVEQLDIGSNNQNYYYVQPAKIIFTVTSPDFLPPNVLLLRNQEYEADSFAVRYITHDLSTKLLFEEIIWRHSSLGWELIGLPLPSMTLQQRIDELHGRSAYSP